MEKYTSPFPITDQKHLCGRSLEEKGHYKPKEKRPGRAGSNNEKKKKTPDGLEIRGQKRMRSRGQCKEEDQSDSQAKQRRLGQGRK